MPHQNNFALIRLTLSIIVIIIHIAILAGSDAMNAVAAFLTPTSAARAFFTMSGFLVVMSYERSKSLTDYAWRRLIRVYPAYAAVVLVCAILLPVAIDGAWLRYLLANLGMANFLAPSLPGVFESNPFDAVNGSLWTVKVEMMFYASVPALAWAVRRWGPEVTLVSAYTASVIFEAWALAYAPSLVNQLPTQMSLFAAGALIYYRLDWFMRHKRTLLPTGLIAFVLASAANLSWLVPAALAVVTMSLGLSRQVADPAKHGDFSYGLYLAHFPIIQVLVAAGLPRTSLALYVAASFALTSLAAFALWHLIEKPAMRFRFQRRGSLVSA